jgi:hypothetical protein
MLTMVDTFWSMCLGEDGGLCLTESFPGSKNSVESARDLIPLRVVRRVVHAASGDEVHSSLTHRLHHCYKQSTSAQSHRMKLIADRQPG